MDFNPRSPDGERPTRWPTPNSNRYFNPRSPDGERPSKTSDTPSRTRFQSTLPGWGATVTTSNFNVYYKPFQSTLPGWGATQIHAVSFLFWAYFNPRSPDGERPGDGSPLPGRSIFQSTLPGWGATNQLLTNPSSQGISIHAPRMGSDRNMSRRPRSRTGISIHAPRMGSDCGLRRRCG